MLVIYSLWSRYMSLYSLCLFQLGLVSCLVWCDESHGLILIPTNSYVTVHLLQYNALKCSIFNWLSHNALMGQCTVESLKYCLREVIRSQHWFFLWDLLIITLSRAMVNTALYIFPAALNALMPLSFYFHYSLFCKMIINVSFSCTLYHTNPPHMSLLHCFNNITDSQTCSRHFRVTDKEVPYWVLGE